MAPQSTSPRKEERRAQQRARLQADREAAALAQRRRRRFTVAGVIALALAVVGGAALAVGNGGSSSPGNAVATAAKGPLVTPAHADGTTALVYGSADAMHTLAVYEDPRCPYCGLLERGLGEDFQRLADKGDYRIEYHIASFLDDGLGGSGSKNAVNALGAALNQGQAQFAAFHNALYKQQPEEKDDAFADNGTLIDLAAGVKGLDSAAFEQAVDKGTYVPWAVQLNKKVNASLDGLWKQNGLPGNPGTPAVFLDGKPLTLLKSSGSGTAAVGAADFEKQVHDALSGTS